MSRTQSMRPTPAFIGASWLALGVGTIGYLVGLWNASMQASEKGYYFGSLLYGLFSAVSLQKSVRDRIEGIPVTALYFGLCWLSLAMAVLLVVVGLWNAPFARTEKGYYAMAFLMSLFAAVAVQKNVRDLARLDEAEARVPVADAMSES